jgi:protein-disulfide isomerase
LPFHRQARPAAAAALEVRLQRGDEAFWKMTDRLFGRTDQEAEQLDAATLASYASEFDVDMNRYDTAMKTGIHDAVIERDMVLADELGFSGTPTFVVGGYKLVGAQPLSRFERLVRLVLENR